jgi:hypothetical protein
LVSPNSSPILSQILANPLLNYELASLKRLVRNICQFIAFL